jgi:hypothetical protein
VLADLKRGGGTGREARRPRLALDGEAERELASFMDALHDHRAADRAQRAARALLGAPRARWKRGGRRRLVP